MKRETVDKSKTLIGCFLVTFFQAGAGGVSSIYFVESINQYNIDRKQASFPYILGSLMYPLAGPLAGYLEHVFGIKVVITTGCLLGTISIGACCLAEGIIAITVLWGALFGIAHGFACLAIPSLLNKHFPKHMSKSNGLMFAGSAIGGILMPPILQVCLQFYGYSGSFLIMSAIMAQSIPASLLCKIPPNATENKPPDHKSQVIAPEEVKVPDIGETNKDESECICKLHISNETENNQQKCTPVNLNTVCKCTYEQVLANPHSNCSNADTNNKLSKSMQITKSFQKHLLTFHKFSIFLDPAFILILIINAGTGFMIIVIRTAIVDIVRDKEIDESLFVYYVMIFYASELAGHFISGYIIDKQYCTYIVMTSISFFFFGIFTVAFIFFKNYIVVMLCVVFISFFIASLILLPISLLHEYMEDDTKTMSISCRYILHTPISLTVPYAIGYFRGTKGSYNGVLFIFVGISMFCACVVYFIPHLVKLRRTTKRSDISKNRHMRENNS